jgi:hypothetical protein
MDTEQRKHHERSTGQELSDGRTAQQGTPTTSTARTLSVLWPVPTVGAPACPAAVRACLCEHGSVACSEEFLPEHPRCLSPGMSGSPQFRSVPPEQGRHVASWDSRAGGRTWNSHVAGTRRSHMHSSDEETEHPGGRCEGNKGNKGNKANASARFLASRKRIGKGSGQHDRPIRRLHGAKWDSSTKFDRT